MSALYPYLGGSPDGQAVVLKTLRQARHQKVKSHRRQPADGICYETLDAIPVPPSHGGGTYYRCRRSLLEIKTPYKLRVRQRGGDFYPMHRQRNGLRNCVPGSYYDQVMGAPEPHGRREGGGGMGHTVVGLCCSTAS